MRRKFVILLAAGGLVGGLVMANVATVAATPVAVQQSPDRLDNVSTCKTGYQPRRSGQWLLTPGLRGAEATVDPQSGYFAMCGPLWGSGDGALAWVTIKESDGDPGFFQVGLAMCWDINTAPCWGPNNPPHFYLEAQNCSGTIIGHTIIDLGAADTAPHTYAINHTPTGADHWTFSIDGHARATAKDSDYSCLDPDTQGVTARWEGETWDTGGDSIGSYPSHLTAFTNQNFTLNGTTGWQAAYTYPGECDVQEGYNHCSGGGGNHFSVYTLNP